MYESKEWKSLSLIARAELIPVIEDVRPGAFLTISKEFKPNLEQCIQESEILYHVEDYSSGNSRYLVSKNKEMLNDTFSYWKSVYDSNSECLDYKYHNLMGNFFGYPQCCIDYFVDAFSCGRMPGRDWNGRAAVSFKKGTYNDVFNYVFHLPCRVNCKETRILGENLKDVLEKYDMEAAETIKNIKLLSILKRC
ncbi:MAG: hypothetical protein KKA79_04690 [Nanoarchaeota archaeon]|nr:hypothetical protein [Nanoarchaeota archaeon]MCG2717373.1 hypothetical protein [Nanoarchaeota archaeon]